MNLVYVHESSLNVAVVVDWNSLLTGKCQQSQLFICWLVGL